MEMVGSRLMMIIIVTFMVKLAGKEVTDAFEEEKHLPSYSSGVLFSPRDVEEAVSAAAELVQQNCNDSMNAFLRMVPEVTPDEVFASVVAETAFRHLLQRYHLSKTVVSQLAAVNVISTKLQSLCPESYKYNCKPQKYRNVDGRCNNVKQPQWGNAFACFQRLLPSSYNDGISLSTNSDKPTSVRIVSDRVNPTKDWIHNHFNAIAAVWGQFITFDIAHVKTLAVWKDLKNENKSCATFSRSIPCLDCQLGSKEAMNFATAFLDGSVLYGSTEKKLGSLRKHEGGLLEMPVGKHLPIEEACSEMKNKSCILSGNDHVNSNFGMTAMLALWIREHNRIAKEFGELNRHWDEETLFQEARRIVVAEIQHITYNEFLPALLGEAMVEEFRLRPESVGHHSNYNSKLNPAVFSEVAIAALKVMSSLLPGKLDFSTLDGQALSIVNWHSKWNDIIQNNRTLKDVMTGLIKSPAKTVGPFFAPSFESHVKEAGGHHAAVTLWEDDYGFPSYTTYRELCGLGAAKSFLDLKEEVDEEALEKLAKLFRSASDIDLVTGMLSEKPVAGAAVGPTCACLLSQQFVLLRNSDRFWYESSLSPHSFSSVQLQQVRKASLASIICNNVEDVEEIHPRAFVLSNSYFNAPMSCRNHAKLDFSSWKVDKPSIQVPQEIILQSLEEAQLGLKKHLENIYQLWKKSEDTDPKSSVGTAAAFSPPNEQSLTLSNVSMLLEFTSRAFLTSIEKPHFHRVKRQLNLLQSFVGDTNDASQRLPLVDVSPFLQVQQLLPNCGLNEEISPCDSISTFHTFSGWCNNLENPSYGQSVVPFTRLLSPAYDDGISHPRVKSVNGLSLPTPRLVSTIVHQDVSRLHRRYSLMLMQFAQFLDHDVTLTPFYRGFQNSILNCRDCESYNSVHPECWPIPVPTDDPYYPPLNVSSGRPFCIPFARSLPGQQRLGPREQINQNTAYIDASQIYGENICKSRSLRGAGGRLNVTRHPVHGKDLMPQTSTVKECKAASGYCFYGGDPRASEQPALATVHVIFLREHNRIVSALEKINPHWNEEKLYQHARRIMIAVNQHVVYNEFLPRVLGWNVVNLYGLRVQSEGYFTGYDPSCKANIMNEFSTAAFRFGHSLIRPSLARMDPSYKSKKPYITLREGFFNSDMLYEAQMVDEIIRGLVHTPMENLDQFVTNEITNHLFENRQKSYTGLDLIALNIQRGRDHGIRPYNDYRTVCNLKRARGFDDLIREIAPEVIYRLQQVYTSVDDIDLFTGGLVERPLQGGLLGPTFACIIGMQFRQLKKCDRFWYETSDPIVKFTEAQLAEIRKVTLSKVICDNFDVPSDIQKAAFDQPDDFLNPSVHCNVLPSIDLTAWREQRAGCRIGGRQVPVGRADLPSPCRSCVCTSEGVKCASLRITNCQQLFREANREAIAKDSVCMAQCGFLVNIQASKADARSPKGRFRPAPHAINYQPDSQGSSRSASLRERAGKFLKSFWGAL